MKISETLRKAADEFMWSGWPKIAGNKEIWSCHAIQTVEGVQIGLHSQSPATMFVKSLGCNPGSGDDFDEFPEGPERQGARFLWLHFAALVAEDMGK